MNSPPTASNHSARLEEVGQVAPDLISELFLLLGGRPAELVQDAWTEAFLLARVFIAVFCLTGFCLWP